MVSFGEKAKIKKVGNLNQSRSYVITTVSTDPDFQVCEELSLNKNVMDKKAEIALISEQKMIWQQKYMNY